MNRGARAATSLWPWLLAAVVLGPALLGRGYVLTYDMVWVPDLALRPDLLGTGTALPRAVPSDAVVALLDELVPGMLLQRLVLYGALVAAALGTRRLVGRSLPAQWVAMTAAIWNPFVAERLVIGHWPVLLGYAALPWLALAAGRARRTGVVPAALPLLLVAGSLSASAGLVSALVVLVFGLRRGGGRATARLLACVVAANLPWLVAGLTHASAAVADPDGARLFGTQPEGSLPAPLAALTLGGIWNAEVVPGSRSTWLAWTSLVVLVVLAVLGRRAFLATTPDAPRWLVVGGLGLAVALVGWASPATVGWLGEQVPGLGLLRDSTRMLALLVPVEAALLAAGAAVVVGRARDAQWVVAPALVVVPVLLLPDLAWGGFGALRPVSYPASYAVVRDAVEERASTGPGGDLLVLPFTAYRAPEWNGLRSVLDPLGRHLTPDHVASDVLLVGGTEVAGEDPRGPRVLDALALPAAPERAAALASLGVRFVATDDSVRLGEEENDLLRPDVPGDPVVSSGELRVVELARPTPSSTPVATAVALGAAWTVWLGWPLGALLLTLRRRHRARGGTGG
ncbi:hypothetical protein [uncultured Nocardioides sp.]|uniref:Uncharacterized protein n=1 Tax=uncultured Nocardioides sp. TaxID=198441 RepID=A0A6J4PM72_9ACTN|nr:hypothetical protein [uncultured Nocardioides sp.]CAA9417953.1 MAG: hypothetical protein AVDCRST_MAG06-3325 [uncultured Nocardioides sp.]